MNCLGIILLAQLTFINIIVADDNDSFLLCHVVTIQNCFNSYSNCSLNSISTLSILFAFRRKTHSSFIYLVFNCYYSYWAPTLIDSSFPPTYSPPFYLLSALRSSLQTYSHNSPPSSYFSQSLCSPDSYHQSPAYSPSCPCLPIHTPRPKKDSLPLLFFPSPS